MSRARDCLIEARKVNGFAIPGLEVEYSRCIDALGVFTDDVDKAARAAGRMAQALDVANFDYARANDASLDLYRQVNRTVTQAASEQDRRSSRRSPRTAESTSTA